MDEQEVVLGRNVTKQAKAKEGPKDTVVLSVRLSHDEFKMLEAIARSEGRTLSQLAREAFGAVVGTRRYADQMRGAVVSWEGSTVRIGYAPGSATVGSVDTTDYGSPNPRRQSADQFVLVR